MLNAQRPFVINVVCAEWRGEGQLGGCAHTGGLTLILSFSPQGRRDLHPHEGTEGIVGGGVSNTQRASVAIVGVALLAAL